MKETKKKYYHLGEKFDGYEDPTVGHVSLWIQPEKIWRVIDLFRCRRSKAGILVDGILKCLDLSGSTEFSVTLERFTRIAN